MITIEASELVYKYSQIDIWSIPGEWVNVIFSDKDVVMEKNQIIGSWYYWEMYRHFPPLDIHSKGAVTEFFTTDTHRKVLGAIYWHIFNSLMLTYDIEIAVLNRLAFQVTNVINNMINLELVEYQSLGSVYDIIEILEQPEIIKAKEDYRKVSVESDYNPFVVSEAMSKMDSVIKNALFSDPGKLSLNYLKKLAIMKLTNINQTLQLIGVRGYCREIDHSIFQYPADFSYAEGANDLYDIAIESRDGSMSKMMQTSPLQLSEYFNRLCQLAASVVLHCEPRVKFKPLNYGGCTNFITVPTTVTESKLKALKGKFHMVNGVPELLWDNVDQYLGKIIDLRSITGCGLLETQHVCHICTGWSSLVITNDINFGYAVSSVSGNLITSKILSTKHLIMSTIAKNIELDYIARDWFKLNKKSPNLIQINDIRDPRKIRIRIDSSCVSMLSSIKHIAVKELNPYDISTIQYLKIVEIDGEGSQLGNYVTIKLEIGGTGVSMSHELLDYLKTNPYVFNKSNIEFDLTNWDNSNPIFLAPNKAPSVMSFFNTVKQFLEGAPTKNEPRIAACRTRGEALYEFTSIMETDRSVGYNYIHLEILVRALMVKDCDDDSCDLPTVNDTFTFHNLKNIVTTRSLGSLLSSEGQNSKLYHSNFLKKYPAISHIMNVLFGGEER